MLATSTLFSEWLVKRPSATAMTMPASALIITTVLSIAVCRVASAVTSAATVVLMSCSLSSSTSTAPNDTPIVSSAKVVSSWYFSSVGFASKSRASFT